MFNQQINQNQQLNQQQMNSNQQTNINQTFPVIYKKSCFMVDPQLLSVASRKFRDLYQPLNSGSYKLGPTELVIACNNFSERNVDNFLKICQNLPNDVQDSETEEICELAKLFQADQIYNSAIGFIRQAIDPNFTIPENKYNDTNEVKYLYIENKNELNDSIYDNEELQANLLNDDGEAAQQPPKRDYIGVQAAPSSNFALNGINSSNVSASSMNSYNYDNSNMNFNKMNSNASFNHQSSSNFNNNSNMNYNGMNSNASFNQQSSSNFNNNNNNINNNEMNSNDNFNQQNSDNVNNNNSSIIANRDIDSSQQEPANASSHLNSNNPNEDEKVNNKSDDGKKKDGTEASDENKSDNSSTVEHPITHSVVYQIKIDVPLWKCNRFFLIKDGQVIFTAKQKNEYVVIGKGANVHISTDTSNHVAKIVQHEDYYNDVTVEDQKFIVKYVSLGKPGHFSIELSFKHNGNTYYWGPRDAYNKMENYGYTLKLPGEYHHHPIRSRKNTVLQNPDGQTTFIVRKMDENFFEAECHPNVPPTIAFAIALSDIIGPFYEFDGQFAF